MRVREADYFDGSRAPESQGQKGSELATTENPKREQTNLIAKRARASILNHFVEILIKGIKAQARQMSTPATSNQMNENGVPTRRRTTRSGPTASSRTEKKREREDTEEEEPPKKQREGGEISES